MFQRSNASPDPLGPLQRALFFWATPFVVLGFALPIHSRELGASAVEIGGLFSVFTGMTLLLRPVVGWAADRYGRRPFLLAALGCYLLAMATFALANTVDQLFIGRLVQGGGSSMLWISVKAMIADLSSPGERGRQMGRLEQTLARGQMLGAGAGFAFFMWLASGLAWQLSFLLYTGMTGIGAWLAWRAVAETKPAAPRHPVVEAAQEAPLLAVRLLLRNGLFLRLLLIVFIASGAQALIWPVFLIFLQDRFTSEITTLALASLPAGLVSVFLAARLGALSDRYGRIRAIAGGLALVGLLSLLLPVVPSLFGLALLYTLSAVGWALARPAEAALVADILGENMRGRGFAVYEIAQNVGRTAGPLAGGWLYEYVGNATPFVVNGATLLLVSAGIFISLRWLSWAPTPAATVAR